MSKEKKIQGKRYLAFEKLKPRPSGRGSGFMKHNLASVVIVRNEEKTILRCIESLKDLGSSLYIVHDGLCDDSTIDICQRFTKNIYIRPFIGEAEPHRAWVYNKIKEDWIFQIDADEYIDQITVDGIKNIIFHNNEKIDAYDFIWPYYDGKKSEPMGGLENVVCLEEIKFHL